jgi:histidine decarboxylase
MATHVNLAGAAESALPTAVVAGFAGAAPQVGLAGGPAPAGSVASRDGLNGRHAQQTDVLSVLGELATFLDDDRTTNVGFPSTFDIDYTPLWPFFNRVLNNVGDPFEPSAFPANTKPFERQVLEWFAMMLRAPERWWGVSTSGGTEGIEYGLLRARNTFPDGLVIHSAAAHYSVPKLVTKLRMPSVVVQASQDGRIDQHHLREAVGVHRRRPIIVVATIGTTMTEAVDDVAVIREVFDDLAVSRFYIHADGALSGLPLALLPVGNGRPNFDLSEGADSISVSGHKFLGSPFPCGVYLASGQTGAATRVEYIATSDTTLAGSRSGHAPLLMWYAINTLGADGLRSRAQAARHTAQYAVDRLNRIGWRAWRHPYAFTVVMDTPPDTVARRWRLASSSGQSHLITMPGITVHTIDELVTDLVAHTGASGSHVGTHDRVGTHREPAEPVTNVFPANGQAANGYPGSHHLGGGHPGSNHPGPNHPGPIHPGPNHPGNGYPAPGHGHPSPGHHSNGHLVGARASAGYPIDPERVRDSSAPIDAVPGGAGSGPTAATVPGVGVGTGTPLTAASTLSAWPALPAPRSPSFDERLHH